MYSILQLTCVTLATQYIGSTHKYIQITSTYRYMRYTDIQGYAVYKCSVEYTEYTELSIPVPLIYTDTDVL